MIETFVRGLFIGYAPNDSTNLALFSGSEDDSTGDNLWGTNLQITLGDANVNVGYLSETAGDIDESATTAAIEYALGDATAIYEHVSMGESDYKFNHYEIQYTMAELQHPVTFAIGQSKGTQPEGTDDSDLRVYSVSMELREGLSVIADFSDTDLDGVDDDVETTTLKVAYEF